MKQQQQRRQDVVETGDVKRWRGKRQTQTSPLLQPEDGSRVRSLELSIFAQRFYSVDLANFYICQNLVLKGRYK